MAINRISDYLRYLPAQNTPKSLADMGELTMPMRHAVEVRERIEDVLVQLDVMINSGKMDIAAIDSAYILIQHLDHILESVQRPKQ